jgi:hypothetical protein
MHILNSATKDDMVRAFQSAEPERWAARGYPNRYIFQGFPIDSCDWAWASLSASDLGNVRQIRNERSWSEIAGPDRTPQAAATWVANNPHDGTSKTISAIHEHLVNGGSVPPIILVNQPPNTDLVVLEGNKRMVAVSLGGVDFSAMRFLLGRSPHMDQWFFYDDQ